VAAPKESPFFPEWDYLIVTASNDRQAGTYRSQIGLRESFGLVHGIKKTLVIPDPGGLRVGSGGSTIHCLLHVLGLELGAKRGAGPPADPKTWAGVFGRLRILIDRLNELVPTPEPPLEAAPREVPAGRLTPEQERAEEET